MPAYAYQCQSCGAKFKLKQSFLDMPVMHCPKCHQRSVRRVPQVPAIIFRGSGWYSTDHRSAASPTSIPSKKND